MYRIEDILNRINEVYSIRNHTILGMAVKMKNQVWLLKTLSSIKVDINCKYYSKPCPLKINLCN